MPTPAKNYEHMVWSEILFIVFAFGFLLDEFTAAQEHGWDSRFPFMPILAYAHFTD